MKRKYQINYWIYNKEIIGGRVHGTFGRRRLLKLKGDELEIQGSGSLLFVHKAAGGH
jgi:hypothetical protein